MNKIVFLLVPGFLILGSCLSTRGSTVERVDTDKVIDLTANWNDSDSQIVAQNMVANLLGSAWIDDFSEDRNPVLVLGPIENETSEDISIPLLSKDFEAALVNSGRVDIVANSYERASVRGERVDQQTNASEETMKRMAQESGADYMLLGNLTSNVQETVDQKVTFYQVSMELVDLESNKKVWIGNEKIKKIADKMKSRRTFWSKSSRLQW